MGFSEEDTEVNNIFIISYQKFYSSLLLRAEDLHKLFGNLMQDLSLLHLLMWCFSFIPQISVCCVFIYIFLKIFSNLPFDFHLDPRIFKEVCLGY